jgi:hypothetical protein
LCRVIPEEWNVPEISIRLRLSQGGTPCSKAITYHKAHAKTKIKITMILRGYLLGTMRISSFETKWLLEWAFGFSKCFTLCQIEILLNKAPSRYTRKILLGELHSYRR